MATRPNRLWPIFRTQLTEKRDKLLRQIELARNRLEVTSETDVAALDTYLAQVKELKRELDIIERSLLRLPKG